MDKFSIHQGDQYYIPFTINLNGEDASPSTVDDVRIAVGNIFGIYSKGTVKYNNGKWMLFVPKKMTEKMFKSTFAQVEVRIGDNYIYADKQIVNVSDSILKGEW